MLGLVFSRDRAMQLDCTLRSFFLHCQDPSEIRLFVIYKTTNAFHARQYARLAQEFAPQELVHFVEQRRFRRDVLGLLLPYARNSIAGIVHRFLMSFGSRLGFLSNLWLAFDQPYYVLFLVDDSIFVRDFSLHEVRQALATYQSALGFSLRLGANIAYCYMSGNPQVLPNLTRLTNNMLRFDWTTAQDDFGYPLEVSSSVYQVNELLPLLNQLPFGNPNTLEGQMAAHAQQYQKKAPHLLFYEQSVAFCNPINKVQTVYTNRAGENLEYSSEHLAQMFAAGYRINVEAYSGFVPNACHQEVKLIFEARETVAVNA